MLLAYQSSARMRGDRKRRCMCGLKMLTEGFAEAKNEHGLHRSRQQAPSPATLSGRSFPAALRALPTSGQITHLKKQAETKLAYR